MCVGVEYLTFDILLQAKSEKKVIRKLICTPTIFKKDFFLLRNMYTFTFVSGAFGM